MRRAAMLLFLACAAAAQDPGAGTRAFIEVATPKDAWFAGEAIPITMRIGWDPEYFKTNVIQATRQELDVPVQVDASFLRELIGATSIHESDPDSQKRGTTRTFALNEGPGRGREIADRVVAGRPFKVIELTRRFQADRAGKLVIPGPELRFSHASRFDEDLVNGRVPVDRREALLRADDRTLEILPLPAEGRPPGFTGAVGHFTIRATAEPRALNAGESLKLTLTIEGDGNLRSFTPPRLDALPGFRNLGVIEQPQTTARVLVYDLTPVDENVKAIPAIAFACFEPDPRARYRILKTEPIPVSVRPGAASAPASRKPEQPASRVEPPESDLADLMPVDLPRAEAAYRAGKYDEARALFEAALEETDGGDPALLYDIGNCALRMKRPAEAILFFRRALLRAPRDGMIRSNLRVAERQVGVEGPAPRLWDSFSGREIAGLASVIGALGIVGLLTGGRRALRIAALFLVVAAIVIGVFAAERRWSPARDGVVIGDDVALRADPHPEVGVTMRLRAGEMVRIGQATDRWVHVAHARGEGWTEWKGVGVID